MTWVKLDDGFISHPKTLQLPHKSIVLHIAGLTYCCVQLTDGIVPKSALKVVLGTARVTKASLQPLVDVGMWREAKAGSDEDSAVESDAEDDADSDVDSAYPDPVPSRPSVVASVKPNITVVRGSAGDGLTNGFQRPA